MAEIPAAEAAYLHAALQAAHAARNFLQWMEAAAEQLAPERISALASDTQDRHGEAMRSARQDLAAASPPDALAPFAARLAAAFAAAERAFEAFTNSSTLHPSARITAILAAVHHCAQAQESFYHLRQPLTPFAGFWLLPGAAQADPPARRDGDDPTGITHVGTGGHHGGFSLYVPETYSRARHWPVVVALHGGSGNGRDFLWTWVREAKSFGYLVVAPSSVADTWSESDDRGLLEILAWLQRRYAVADDRILLTGLSDGATFTLLYGLAHPQVYRALAPLCGVLHPANEMVGNLSRARDVPIYLVHGARDFLFPVQLARLARDTLTASGAALEYRELSELSHTYPRSENPRILRWFEALATKRN